MDHVWTIFQHFGLTNSLATFQTMMNDIFHDMIAEGVVCVYLDDILIFTKTLLEHQTITWRVLKCLREYNLCLKREECEFEWTQIEYLGVIVSEGTVEMDLVKVSGVSEWLEPWNKREVQSFVRFINFYQWFIKDFSHHVCALFDLTKKDVRWQWGVRASLFQLTQGADHLCACPCLPQWPPPLPYWGWLFWCSHWSSVIPADLIREWWKMAPNCLLLQESQPGRVELWDPWQGDVSHYPSTRGMAALPWRHAMSVWNLDRPQKPWVLPHI